LRLGNSWTQFHVVPLGFNSLVVVSDTVHLVGEVHCEGDTIKALVANDTSETAWVIGLPHSL
jgi:hypothetical protein